MPVRKLILFLLLLTFAVQTLPIEWARVFSCNAPGSADIEQMIEFCDTEEDAADMKDVKNDHETKIFSSHHSLSSILTQTEGIQVNSFYLLIHINEFHREILIPPPNITA